ncbi:MAG: SRPBCC domain-containing protein [Pseudomonadota bacterium]
MSEPVSIPPVVKKLRLNAPAEKAFHHFTQNIHLWWPLSTHSLAQNEAISVVFEARKGGRIFETTRDGKQRDWGTVLECDAPNRIVFSWVLEDLPNATEIEVEIEEEAQGGCILTLTHRGWETREAGEKWRDNYQSGWDGVLAAYSKSLTP